MSFSTLSDWLSYIESLHTSNIDLGLARVKWLAEKMQLVHFDCPVIIVGGTNGKGSCVRLLECIYSCAGYRVAAYTSPHLFRFNERIRFVGNEISDKDLIQCFAAIEKQRHSNPLSFFEYTTLSALYFFKINRPDIIILEVGLGGRLDAVNVVEPDLSIISTVDIDHCDWLGKDRESIGFEKAGIFRKNKPAIFGDLYPPKRVLEQAEKLHCDLYLLDQDYGFTRRKDQWEWWSPVKIISDLPLPILKIQNAATALMAVELLQSSLPIHRDAISRGIFSAKLPGRFECVSSLWVNYIFDVAHNPQAARNLANQMNQSEFSGKTYAVIGMLRDKNIAETLFPLLTLIDTWFVADLHGPRAELAANIITHLQKYQVKNYYSFNSVKKALTSAVFSCQSTKSRARILIFGSFYTVAEAKQCLWDYCVSSEKEQITH